MDNCKTVVQDETDVKVQTGIRISQPIIKALKMLATENNITIGDVIEKLTIENYRKKNGFTEDDITFLDRYFKHIIKDTVIVAADTTTFNNDYMSNKHWWSCIEIAKWRIPHLKYLAVYQTAKISTITYYSEIDKIQLKPGTTKSYNIYLKGARNQVLIKPMPHLICVQGRVYTELQKIKSATDMTQVL